MDGQSGITCSLWMSTAENAHFDRLTQDIDVVDVCVIGAGISGLSTAYMLASNGQSVLVLDDGPIAAGETQRTTAHITNVLDKRYFEIQRMHGKTNARLAAESLGAAINRIETIVTAEQIDCDFQRVNGYLFLDKDSKPSLLRKELKAVQECGFLDVQIIDQLPFGLQISALQFPRQAQFHVLKYLNGLCRAITKCGGRIFAFEHVAEIQDGRTVKVKTSSGHTVTARSVVVATNSPVSDSIKMHTKQAAYRTYVIGAIVPAVSMEQALYWDTADPYHYMRLQPVSSNQNMLILGGEDHRTGEKNDADERFMHLENWLRVHVPQARGVEFRWSGQVYEPEDGLGYVGRDPAHGDNVYLTTGSSGVGMTHATMSAIVITDLINGRENAWAKLYNPRRKPLLAPVEFIKENANSIAQYSKRFTPSQVKSIDEIQPGEGALMWRNGKQLAVSKDMDGNVHEHSAVCKHLGATVCWNSCEKSWDCSAHGSRFDETGSVIDGPANANLDPAETEAERRRGAA